MNNKSQGADVAMNDELVKIRGTICSQIGLQGGTYSMRAMGQFWKRLASIIAVRGGPVERHVQVFNMTALHCSD